MSSGNAAAAAAAKGQVGDYDQAVEYWDRQPATADGVLGGFGFVSDADLRDSEELLERALEAPLAAARKGERRLVAVDCGAGVGRVTGGLLLRHFAEVDLLEPSRHLLDTAVRDLGARAADFPQGHKVGRVLCQGLQDFDPTAEAGEEPRYDCIWVQWCLLYLTDGEVAKLIGRIRFSQKRTCSRPPNHQTKNPPPPNKKNTKKTTSCG
jgi:protein N-terminal methyltransferase